jgi:colanic acid/amylovoran biosynthesis glycosyltransferase
MEKGPITLITSETKLQGQREYFPQRSFHLHVVANRSLSFTIEWKMNSSRRIAYLVSQYPAVNHTYILREIRTLRGLGWEIEVASIRPDTRPVSCLTAEEREEVSRTWYVKKQGFRGALRAHFERATKHTYSYVRGILTALRLGGMDVRKALRNLLYFTEALIVGQWMQSRNLKHTHIHFSSTVGLLLAKAFPLTISMTIHGPAEFEEPVKFHLPEKIEASTFVCSISNYGKNQLMKFCGPDQWRKLETIPLGIDCNLFVSHPRTHFKCKSFDVISVGRLSPEKAQHILIDAVAQLLKGGRVLRLRLVGEGPDRSTLEKHIIASRLSENVHLEGALNQDQLRALYRESDAFALASFAEGVPVVLMEAMAMEIPCVATRIAGIPELIQDDVNGLLVAPSDTRQLAAAIARLMDDPDLCRRIAGAGRRKIMEHYNLSKNTLLLANVFERQV